MRILLLNYSPRKYVEMLPLHLLFIVCWDNKICCQILLVLIILVLLLRWLMFYILVIELKYIETKLGVWRKLTMLLHTLHPPRVLQLQVLHDIRCKYL